ncbi:MAG: cyclodeaminase/cyclohydrolase family protein, partial [Microbacteriaceae bacterium]
MSDTVDRSTPLDAWTARLAAPVGDPGGGAAGAVALALGAGLLSMVAGYTVDSPAAEALRGRADALRERALRLADDD